jgi:phospholipase C
MTLDELRANVDTIVILIMENRSFDHVLGHLKSPAFGNRPDVEGIDNLTNLDVHFVNPVPVDLSDIHG